MKTGFIRQSILPCVGPPNMRPRILFNSLLNGSGKFGAKFGNSAGVLALLYTVLERQLAKRWRQLEEP